MGDAEQRTIASDVFGKTIQWSSSDNAIVPVDAQGVVTSQRGGTAILTAKVDNAQSTCKVTVNPDVYVAGHIGNT